MPIEIPISKSVRLSGSTNWPPFIGPASFGWTGHVGFIHDVLKREYLAGYPRPGAATGTAGDASAPRATRRCRFFPARTLRVGNQDVCASRTQVGKPAATGTAGDASAPRDTRRCRFFTCTNATGRKPGRVCEQSAGRKTCGYVGEQKLSAGRKPAATGHGAKARVLPSPGPPTAVLETPGFPALIGVFLASTRSLSESGRSG